MQSEVYLNNSREISQIEQIMRFSGRWQEHGDCLLVDLESGVDQDLQEKKILLITNKNVIEKYGQSHQTFYIKAELFT